MSVHKALAHKSNLEKINENLSKQGFSKEKKSLILNSYLEEAKRKHLKESGE